MLAQTHRHAALLLALSTLAPACMGFDRGDDFGDDMADADAGDDGRDGAEGGDAGEDSGLDCRPNDSDPTGPEICEPTDPTEPGMCEPSIAELIAGQQFDTGTVTISNDDDSVSVEVQTAEPYELVEVHVYVGTGPVPTNDGNAVAPGQFPYTHEFIEPATNWVVDVPLAELEVGCDDELMVAVHATVVSFENGMEVFEETAWGYGDNEFETSWGWSIDYGVCCEEPEQPPRYEGCTLTRGFWQTHNAYAEVPALLQPWPISEDSEMCGQTWLDILLTQPEGDAWLILAHQTIAAMLNVADGASMPADVEGALADAKQFLAACAISDADRDAALDASEMLDAYNNGDIGPGHCE